MNRARFSSLYALLSMLYQWLIRLTHQCICERAVKMTARDSFDSDNYRVNTRHQRGEEDIAWTQWRQRANQI